MNVKAVIDRMEGEKAVLLIGETEDNVIWPRSCLPEDAKEGDILNMKLFIDVEATRAAKEEMLKLLEQISE